ncbi:MAG: hypothetical protein M3256_21245 [Actinomycetota bacterium]|nr:hypothetical protein [Actinomycetota bacterium]
MADRHGQAALMPAHLATPPRPVPDVDTSPGDGHDHDGHAGRGVEAHPLPRRRSLS